MHEHQMVRLSLSYLGYLVGRDLFAVALDANNLQVFVRGTPTDLDG
jgi:hypothetical protein